MWLTITSIWVSCLILTEGLGKGSWNQWEQQPGPYIHCTSRKLGLPVDIQLELFNTMVVPVLTYGCEIQGGNIIREIEILHMKFMKHILYVHR